MKKLLILLVLWGTSSLAFSQEFGNTLVSGSVNYIRENRESDQNYINPNKSSSFSFNPKIGFFLSPNLVLGVSAGYARSSFTSKSQAYTSNGEIKFLTNEYTSNSYSAGPFVRLYKSIGNNFAFFGQGSAFYSKTTDQSEWEDPNMTPSTYNYRGGGAEITPGIVFFPGSVIGIELTMGRIGYSSYKGENGDQGNASKYSNFNANFGLSSVSLGISLYLGRSGSE